MSAYIALGLLVAAGLILVFRHDAGTIAGLEMADFAGIMTAVALLIYLGRYLFSDYQGRLTNALKDSFVWALLCLILVSGYSYRTELSNVAHRVLGELSPPGSGIPLVTKPGSGDAIRIRRRPDGHFIAQTDVNGRMLRMIVDTGASTVVLRHEDAKSLGVNTDALIYSVQVQTANGISMSARATLEEVAIGPVRLKNVDALIASPGALHQSLLGMSFLSRLRSYEFSGDFLTLRS